MTNPRPESDRLKFRDMNHADLDDLYRMFADNYARRFYPLMADMGQVRGWIDWNLRNYAEHGFGLWVLNSKQSEVFVGDCGLSYQIIDGKRELEIGYHLEASQRGSGYALEAARAAMKYGFEETEAEAIYSIVAPTNEASVRVAQRLHCNRGEFINEKGLRRLSFHTSRSEA
jgi:RimJ/RimL family protein N-acetyltransferase